MRIKTLFFGSSEFSVTILKSLLLLDYIEIVGVITQMDKEFGRKKELKSTPIKEFVKSNYPNIKIFEPEKIKVVSHDIVNETTPELIIVAAYGKILPDVIINYPKYKCLNVHGSLLPKLRGAVPVQSAILQGFTETGVSVQIMKMEMDEGDILFSKEVSIDPKETTETLMIKLALVGAEVLSSNLLEYINGGITPTKQDETEATYCFLSDMSYEKGMIDWNTSSVEIERKIRAFNPEPIAYSNGLTIKELDGKPCDIKFSGNIRIYETSVFEMIKDIKVGECIVENNRLCIKTSDNFIEILKLQLSGKNVISSKDFINGLKNRI